MLRPHSEDWQRNRSENLVDEAIAGVPIILIVRAVIEFDRQHRGEVVVTKDEIKMLTINPVKMRLPRRGALRHGHEIGQPDLCENRVAGHEPPENLIEGMLRGGEEIFLLRIGQRRECRIARNGRPSAVG